jgi:hypothetical protein
MANGDLVLTTPKSIPNLPLAEVNIVILPSPFMTVTFVEVDATGPAHVVRITNSSTNAAGAIKGFDYAAGVFTETSPTPGNNYLTTILGVLFIGDASTLNQRKSALVTRLKTDNVITVAGTVG